MFSVRKNKFVHISPQKVKTKTVHSLFDYMEKKDRFIIIIAVIICILLLFISITPLFGIEEPIFFLIIAVPTCVILTFFWLKVRYDMSH